MSKTISEWISYAAGCVTLFMIIYVAFFYNPMEIGRSAASYSIDVNTFSLKPLGSEKSSMTEDRVTGDLHYKIDNRSTYELSFKRFDDTKGLYVKESQLLFAHDEVRVDVAQGVVTVLKMERRPIN